MCLCGYSNVLRANKIESGFGREEMEEEVVAQIREMYIAFGENGGTQICEKD